LVIYGDVSLVRLRASWMTNHPPLVLQRCQMGCLTCKDIISNMACVSGELEVKPYWTNLSLSRCVFLLTLLTVAPVMQGSSRGYMPMFGSSKAGTSELHVCHGL